MLERHWRPGEVINALTSVGPRFVQFDECPELFWNQFEEIPSGTLERLPHTYSIVMRKR